jgi:hypothetical protein
MKVRKPLARAGAPYSLYALPESKSSFTAMIETTPVPVG